MLGVPLHVMADIKIEVAIVIQVGKRRRRRVVAHAREPGTLGHVFEGAIAAVPVERVGREPADEEIGMAVVIVVANRHAQAVSAGRAILPIPDASLTSTNVPSPRLRNSRSHGGGSASAGEFCDTCSDPP